MRKYKSNLGYICVNCRSSHEEGSKYYAVLDSDGLYEPTCCVQCANEIKNRNIEKAVELLNGVKDQVIEEEIWE